MFKIKYDNTDICMYTASTRNTTSWKSSALGGAGAGFFSRIVSAPFDVIKIRMQLDASKINNINNSDIFATSWKRLMSTAGAIYKEEGLITFFRGNIPALCLWVGYGTIQFPIFAHLQQMLNNIQEVNLKNNNNNNRMSSSSSSSFVFPSATIDFAAGCCAGIVATLSTHPLDVLRTRFAGQGLPKKYNTIWSMLKGTGPNGLYKGISPALLYVAPSMGLTFSSYGFFQKRLTIINSNPLVCGALSGLVTKTVLYPLDIAKKRLQLQGIERNEGVYGPNRKYNGMVDCIIKIVRKEGGIVHGLYKGFLPGMLKSVVSTGATFVFYEYIREKILMQQGVEEYI